MLSAVLYCVHWHVSDKKKRGVKQKKTGQKKEVNKKKPRGRGRKTDSSNKRQSTDGEGSHTGGPDKRFRVIRGKRFTGYALWGPWPGFE